jgi:hypothetical protein
MAQLLHQLLLVLVVPEHCFGWKEGPISHPLTENAKAFAVHGEDPLPCLDMIAHLRTRHVDSVTTMIVGQISWKSTSACREESMLDVW